MFAFGVCENAAETVITPFEIDEISFVSTVPSGKIKDNVGLFVVGKSVLSVSSTVTTVVEVTLYNLPERLTPARTGSLILITAPGLHIKPPSIDVVNVTSSLSLASENAIAFANLCA